MGIQESRRTKLLLCSSTVRQVSNFFSLCLLLEGGRREMVPSPTHCSPAPDFSLKKCNQTTYPFLSIPGFSSWTQLLDPAPFHVPLGHGRVWNWQKALEVKGKPQNCGGRPAGGAAWQTAARGCCAFILPLQPVRISRSLHQTPLLPRVRLLLNHWVSYRGIFTIRWVME